MKENMSENEMREAVGYSWFADACANVHAVLQGAYNATVGRIVKYVELTATPQLSYEEEKELSRRASNRI